MLLTVDPITFLLYLKIDVVPVDAARCRFEFECDFISDIFAVNVILQCLHNARHGFSGTQLSQPENYKTRVKVLHNYFNGIFLFWLLKTDYNKHTLVG